MQLRFDIVRKVTGMLLAALLVVALVVPACMTLVCLDMAMTGHEMSGGMNLADCLESGVAHDGLLAPGAVDATGMLLLIVFAALSLVRALLIQVTATGMVLQPVVVNPPPPLDARGERLLI